MDDPKYVKRNYFNSISPGSYSALSGFLRNKKYQSKKFIEDTLASLQTYTLHKPIRKKFPRRKVVVAFMNLLYTADLIDYRRHSRVNQGYRYILVIVDAFSKFLWSIKLKRKNANELKAAFELFFKSSKRRPKYLWVDAGTEFFNSQVKAVLEKHKITLYHTHSKLKASIAEAFVKKVKVKLARVFTHTKKFTWITFLENVTSNINNSYNSSIKMPASEVTKENESQVWYNLYGSLLTAKAIKPVYKPND